MKHFRPGHGWLVFLAAVAVSISSAAAQSATNALPHARILRSPQSIMPPPSPMDYFRRLVGMSPQQREAMLAKKSPEVRQRILAKVNEYAALDPSECEVRLRATELRLYLIPLLHAASADRDAQLALVPANIHDLVQSRLAQWELLPPPLQQEFLENERTLGYFSRMDVTNNVATGAVPSDADQARWNAYSDSERQAMIAQFNQFFELSPLEKQKTLGALPEAERAQMQKTLDSFDQLPPPQRVQCIRAFGKFTEMSPEERDEFLKNAQRWSQMSLAERKAWSDLVAHVPQWKPVSPAMIMPPVSANPAPSKKLHPSIATNL